MLDGRIFAEENDLLIWGFGKVVGFLAATVAPLWEIRSGGATTSTRSRDAYVKLLRGFHLIVIWPIVVASPQ